MTRSPEISKNNGWLCPYPNLCLWLHQTNIAVPRIMPSVWPKAEMKNPGLFSPWSVQWPDSNIFSSAYRKGDERWMMQQRSRAGLKRAATSPWCALWTAPSCCQTDGSSRKTAHFPHRLWWEKKSRCAEEGHWVWIIEQRPTAVSLGIDFRKRLWKKDYKATRTNKCLCAWTYSLCAEPCTYSINPVLIL